MSTETATTSTDTDLDHVPPHLRARVSYTPLGGTEGYLLLAELVALGYCADPDPQATSAWRTR